MIVIIFKSDLLFRRMMENYVECFADDHRKKKSIFLQGFLGIDYCMPFRMDDLEFHGS